MAETLVQIPICSKCGEEARPQALFCFACGGKIVGYTEEEEEAVSSAWFKGDIVEGPSEEAESSVAEEGTAAKTSGEMPADAEVDKLTEDETDVESDIEDKAIPMPSVSKESDNKVKVKAKPEAEQKKTAADELTSAAEIRRRPKAIQTKRVEVVWEDSESGPKYSISDLRHRHCHCGSRTFLSCFLPKINGNGSFGSVFCNLRRNGDFCAISVFYAQANKKITLAGSL